MEHDVSGGTYHTVSRLLHWLMAGLMILAITLVLLRHELEAWTGWRAMGLHKSLGMALFALAVARLGWRLAVPPPPLDPQLAGWARKLAHGGHLLLYVGMLGLPVLGYLASSAGPYPLDFFGLPVPKLAIAKASWLASIPRPGHRFGGYAMTALILGHALAALYHHFVLKDSTLRRMTSARAAQ